MSQTTAVARTPGFSVRKHRRALYDWYLVTGHGKVGFVNPVGRQGWHYDVNGVTGIKKDLNDAIKMAQAEMSK